MDKVRVVRAALQRVRFKRRMRRAMYQADTLLMRVRWSLGYTSGRR